jgi:signal transduction histidine kinase
MTSMTPELSFQARQHIRALLRAIAPAARRLEARFRKSLGGIAWDSDRVETMLGLSPVAAARKRTLAGFFRQVETNARRLASLNTPPPDVTGALDRFGAMLASHLDGRFAPAREQLQLATVLVVNQAFYQVRESETRCFFGLYRAETEAQDLPALLKRFVELLTHTFRARSGRLLLPEGENDPRLAKPLYEERGEIDRQMDGRCASYWSYPMGTRAVLQLGFPERRRWLPREKALLDAAAERFNEAFDRVSMQTKLRLLDAQARQAEEEERRRIARELHDEAGQSLLLLRLELELLEREMPLELRGRMAEARGIAAKTIDELRRLVAALSPAVLERMGLEAALRHLANRFQRVHPAVLRIRIALPEAEIDLPQQRVIYRVAQEALQNIAKHSQATHVNFSLVSTDIGIRLRVRDNGAGFSAERAAKQPMSFGLGGMRERAALHGGTLSIRSSPGKGATVTLELPRPALVISHGKDSHTDN